MAEAAGKRRSVQVLRLRPDTTVLGVINAVMPESDGAIDTFERWLGLPSGPDQTSVGYGKQGGCPSGDREVLVVVTWWSFDANGNAVLNVDYFEGCETDGGGGGGPGDPWGDDPWDPWGDPGPGSGGPGGGNHPDPNVDPCASTDLMVLEANGCLGGAPPDPDPNPDGRRATKNELTAFFKDECGYTNSKTRDDAFEANVRAALGFQATDIESPKGTLDGIRLGHYSLAGQQNNVINSILESKFSEGSPPFSYSQSSAGIDLLAMQYRLIDQSTNFGAPAYVMVSMFKGDLRYTDYKRKLSGYAHNANVELFHYTVTGSAGSYKLEGGLVGQNIIGQIGGKTVSHSFWGDNRSYAFGLQCITE